MRSAIRTAAISKKVLAGLTLSGLAVLFLLFDSVIKLLTIQPVVESFTRLGYPASLSFGIGTLELLCLALYLIPRTRLLGTVLLTGYLGGAVATHVRVGDPLLTHVLFPTYIGALLWGGLLLRDARLRALASQLVRPSRGAVHDGPSAGFAEPRPNPEPEEVRPCASCP